MPTIQLNDLTTDDYAYVTNLQDNFDTIEQLVNGQITDSNIATDANIDPAKIANGGAVVQSELTLTGEALKIPRLDQNGNLIITGKLVFVQGLI